VTASVKAGSDPRLTLSPGVPVALVCGIKTCLPVTGRRAVLFEICNLQFEILRAPRPSATKGAAFGIRQACAAWTAPEGSGLLDIRSPAPALALRAPAPYPASG